MAAYVLRDERVSSPVGLLATRSYASVSATQPADRGGGGRCKLSRKEGKVI